LARRRIATALLVYGPLGLLALAWGGGQGRWNLLLHPDPWATLSPWLAHIGSLLGGLGVAVLVLISTRLLVRRTRWARELHLEFRALLGPLSSGQIAILALSSGLAEEAFFRGAMQPLAGLPLTALLFGAVHVGRKRSFWVWTAWATLMGFVFGLLFEITGSLLGPLLAHILINYENMLYIESYDPRPPPAPMTPTHSRRVDAPALIASRVRAGGRSS